MSKLPKDVLERFLDLLINNNSNIVLLEKLQAEKLLSNNFETRFLLDNTESSFQKINIIEITFGYHVAFLYAHDGCPYRIEMIKLSTWKIKSYMFLCAGCLGEDNICGVCGGSGWGVL